MKVLVAGSTGPIGRAAVERLRSVGHEVARLVRSEPSRPDEFRWKPARHEMDDAALVGCDAVLHLAGDDLFISRDACTVAGSGS